MYRKLGLILILSGVLVCSACAQSDNSPYEQGDPDQNNMNQSYQGYGTRGGFEQNRQDMWGGWTNNRQYGVYDERGTTGLRQYHRYGERGLWERYGDPFGPQDRTIGYDGTAGMALSDLLVNRCENIPGVKDAQVIIYKDDVLVGIQTAKGADIKQIEAKVREALKDEVEGKTIHIVTDEEQFNRLGQIDRQIRDGQPISNFARDLGEMINDIGRTVTEPFRR